MALKGKAEIELTNVKTGEKEYYVEENMFTNALAEFYKPIGDFKWHSYGVYDTERDYDGQWAVAPFTYFLAGIQLWDSTIEENSDIIFKPGGVQSVGCGVRSWVNATTSSKRGSFNASESSYSTSNRTAKFVYDFQTNQANGTIKSISLTGKKGGWNGYGGNESRVDYEEEGTNSSSYVTYSSSVTPYKLYSSNSNRVIFIDPEQDCFYEVYSLYTTSVTIRKCKANFYSISMMQDLYKNHQVLETISITLPTTLSGTNTYLVQWDRKREKCYIVVSPSGSYVSSSGTFHVVEIDTNTWAEPTVYTNTNQIGSSMYVDFQRMTVYDGYIYYGVSGSSYLYKIDITDGTRTSISSPTGYQASAHPYPVEFGGMIYYIVGKRYTSGSNTYYASNLALYDPVGNTKHATGLGMMYTDGRTVPIKGFPFHAVAYLSSSYTNSSGGTSYYYYTRLICYHHNYIATINNLSREIEKTNEKTMKITYTVTEV